MKTVLITGASRGIGSSMVRLFSANGWRVAFTYKNSREKAEALAKECCALAIRADSACEADVNSCVETVERELGEIDCLINNSAVSSFSMFTDLTLEDWNESLANNLTGAFLYSKAVIPSMVRRKSGRIINVSSVWGITGASCEVHYSAAKAGLIGMTKALAKELGPSGITVNAIAPGVIDTDMNRSLTEETLASLREETPLMRVGQPEEVANVALFLAGDGGAFITGEVVNVSGGYLI